MINYLFIPFISSILIISANQIFYTMGTLLVFLIICFFGFLFFNPNTKEQINTNHLNKF